MQDKQSQSIHCPAVPCKDCTDRQLGCHSTCSKYKQYATDRSTYTNTVRARKYEYEDNMRPKYNKHSYKQR